MPRLGRRQTLYERRTAPAPSACGARPDRPREPVAVSSDPDPDHHNDAERTSAWTAMADAARLASVAPQCLPTCSIPVGQILVVDDPRSRGEPTQPRDHDVGRRPRPINAVTHRNDATEHRQGKQREHLVNVVQARRRIDRRPGRAVAAAVGAAAVAAEPAASGTRRALYMGQCYVFWSSAKPRRLPAGRDSISGALS